jgi:hypothetical protein
MVEMNWMSSLRDLGRDERATAMTEFVITLPVFVAIFLGINGLARLQDAATRAHPEANRLMWEQAQAVANSEPDSVWADPGAIGRYQSASVRSDLNTYGYDRTKAMRRYDFGTLGEAMNGAEFEQTRNWPFRFENAQEDECSDCARDWVGGDVDVLPGYAVNATTDNGVFRPTLPSVDPEFADMRAVFSSTRPKSHLAYGAGTRYGLVYGVASREVTWKRFTTTFEPQYQVTAPPRTLETTEEAFGSVATARVELERWEWADLPGFEFEDEFNFLAGGRHAHFFMRRH